MALESYGSPYDPEDIDEQKIATAFERLAKPTRQTIKTRQEKKSRGRQLALRLHRILILRA